MCSWMMLPIKDEANSRTDSSINIWLFLSVEFLIGAIISGFLSILNTVKSLLPKPPRNLAGDVVLVCIFFTYIIHLESYLIFTVNLKYHICTQDIINVISIRITKSKKIINSRYKNK